MKLLFVCTSLEPGRDGVGDYARLLAEACIEAGNECQLLAVNDGFVEIAKAEYQQGRAHYILALRLPIAGEWTHKLNAVQDFVTTFAPDWISWQVVPYGFNTKGVIPREVRVLRQLGTGRRTHILLHELWIGLSQGEPFKNRMWGYFQRRALTKFLGSLHASSMHTTNFTYQEVLRREGWQAGVLPLFGNIPVAETPPTIPEARRWTGGIFGTVHPQFSFKRCFDTLLQGATISGRKLRILGIGRVGEHGEKMFEQAANDYDGRIEFSLTGEKTSEEVSRLLQAMDFGIATHPWALVGKSGAVAAMLDHGLPVVVPRDDWILRKRPIAVRSIDPLMVRLSEMPPELMAGRLAARRPPLARLPEISSMFVSSLLAASSPAFET
ncbi:MAG: hypothetical protein QM790_11125 [Nibricoccus sp.]